uniref:Immunoglobulin domain-containing protein n=1 Tax=Gadus morhua TaxID=8049 RepID=A0A8C4ZUK4_GADMO
MAVLLTVCGGDRDVVVVGLAGHSVTLPCVYDTQYTGGPVRTRFYALLCTYPGRGPPRQETPQAGGRLQLLGRACDGDASLTIQDLQSSDSGLYVCRVRVPGRSNVLKVRVHTTSCNTKAEKTTECAYLFFVYIFASGRGPSLPFYRKHRQNDRIGFHQHRCHPTSPF